MSFIAEKVHFNRKQRLQQLAFIVLVVVVCVAISKVHTPQSTVTLQTQPVGIMGTSCTLRITLPASCLQEGKQLLENAETELRRCEALTSNWLETSEISQFQRLEAEKKLPLSPFTRDVFLRAKKAMEETDGAFDITCGRLWNLWKDAEKTGVPPSAEKLHEGRQTSCWDAIVLEENAILKKNADVEVVTGGIAKGMAIDRALQTLRGENVLSAFVEVGGDTVVWENEMPVQIAGSSETLTLRNGGVCTSGHTERFFEIGGQKYSQILHPQTGMPVPRTFSVTVTAPDAATADIWATALEVLGPEGESLFLQHCPEGKVLFH
ncbi:MAG: FAD:protein FMN transferase [Planctomycetia bacterium]|nr:FAD:protein FMN transferase [Planctomycetia bacterium]